MFLQLEALFIKRNICFYVYITSRLTITAETPAKACIQSTRITKKWIFLNYFLEKKKHRLCSAKETLIY